MDSKKIVVKVTGSKTPSPVVNTCKDIMDLKMPEDRSDLIQELLYTKLCLKKDTYTSNVKYIEICDVIEWVGISKYFKDDKPFTDEAKDLLFYDILLSLKRDEIEVTNEQALYDLLTI